jgi:hypothetical protein
MLDALGRGDLASARSHWLMVDLWVSQVDSINRLTLDMCKASGMPIHRPPRTTRYEREKQVFGGASSGISAGTAKPAIDQRRPSHASESSPAASPAEPALLTNAEPASALVVDSGAGPIPPVHTTPPVVAREAGSTSPSYFPPVLRP